MKDILKIALGTVLGQLALALIVLWYHRKEKKQTEADARQFVEFLKRHSQTTDEITKHRTGQYI